MRFEILGPLRVIDDDGAPHAVPGPQLRLLLAVLLLRVNQPVAVDELTEALWDGAPPRGAAGTVRAHVKRLRDGLGTAGARVRTRTPGYLIELAEPELDLTCFQTLCRDGEAEARAGRWDSAHETLERALGLWHGAPLVDVPSEALRDRELPRIERLRLRATELRVDAALHLGHHDRLVSDLRDLTERHPLRERLHAQLMLALAGSGRRAEALTAYDHARRTLLAELGVEPGPEVRDVYAQIMADAGPPPAPPPALPRGGVPRQLPLAMRYFTGRTRELKLLSESLDQPGGGAVVISAIEGTAGIGKTALAVQWGHRHAERFPDGQLYVNLRGFDPSGAPLGVGEAVRVLLESLGVPSDRIPAGVDARIALYRSRMAGKRLLVLLDNARDAEQVRPLLPGSGDSVVLVTSRNRLAALVALDGAASVTLGLLTSEEACELLERRLGHERATGHEAALVELAELCARLPLALNIVAAHAALRPALPLPDLVRELRDAGLDALTTGESLADVRAMLSWSYRALPPRAARLLRLLALHPGPDIDVATAASLAGIGEDETRRGLAELTAAHMLSGPAPGRYAFHDLLRSYARELAHTQDPEAVRREAFARMADHYLHTAHAAGGRAYPGWLPPELPPPADGVVVGAFADRERADAWYAAERSALVAVTAAAAESGHDTHAWRIPWALAAYLDRKGYWREWRTVSEIALAAARHGGDAAGQAHAHRWLGQMLTTEGSYDDARTHLRASLTLFRRLGDRKHEGSIHLALARMHVRLDQTTEALARQRRALDAYTSARHAPGQAQALDAIGRSLLALGDAEQALAYFERALRLSRELGIERGEAAVLDGLGHLHRSLGRHAEAVEHYGSAVRLLRTLGDRHRLAQSLIRLGDVHAAAGDTPAARGHWHEALDLLDEIGAVEAETVRTRLGAS